MTDRDSFLLAIAANPADDVVRLGYADFLDECGAPDADRACAEFIRISCPMGVKARQTNAEGKWLAANWQNLVPGLAALGYTLHDRSGRKVRAVKIQGVPPQLVAGGGEIRWGEGYTYRRWCMLDFWRGFVHAADVYTARDLEALRAVLPDAPLARLGIADAMESHPNETFLGRPDTQWYREPNKIFDLVAATEQVFRPFGNSYIVWHNDDHRERAAAALDKGIRAWFATSTMTDKEGEL